MERFPLGAKVTVDDLAGPDLHATLARLRATEPVSWLPALNGWLVTDRELAVQVMRDPDTFTVDDPRFSTAQVVGPSMLSLDGDEHARHRVPFGKAFGLARTREHFAEFVEARTASLIDQLEPNKTAELRRAVAGPLAVAVVAEALGLDDADPTTILTWYDAIVSSVSEVTAGHAVSAAGAEAFAHLDLSVRDSIGGDSLLATAASAGGLNETEVVSNAAVIMFGGIETTEGMIANSMWHLLTHPEQLTQVREDPKLIPQVVEESLRLEPAAAVVDRYTTRAVEFGGAELGERELVTVSLAGANRDPASFQDPDAFDPRRTNARQQLAFAQGPHICVGMHVARSEAQVAVRQLLERLPNLRLAEPTAPIGLVFRKPPALHVRWD